MYVPEIHIGGQLSEDEVKIYTAAQIRAAFCAVFDSGQIWCEYVDEYEPSCASTDSLWQTFREALEAKGEAQCDS